jgi:hypothetical protein
MEIRAFCDVAPCSLVVVERRFRGAYYLHHQGGGGELKIISEIVDILCGSLFFL